jgi:hypothetical protein
MTRIERLGMELAEDIRLESDLLKQLTDVQARIVTRMEDIRNVSDSALYESSAEQTLVRPFIPTVSAEDGWQDAGATVKLVMPAELSQCRCWRSDISHIHRPDGSIQEIS